MPASAPELSIIVASYKHPEMLKLCLDSIREHAAAIDHEVIVTDSATEEPTRALMRDEYPDIPLCAFEKNVGFQRIVRAGLEKARGRYILILNYDIIVNPGSLQALLAYLKEHPDVGMVGPKLLNFNGTLQPSCFRYYKPVTILYRRTPLGKLGMAQKHLDWFLMKDYAHDVPKEVDWLMGSALLITREAYEKVGPMDGRFFMYMEDVDWCRRFWENGYKVVYYPLATLYHYHGKGSAKGGFLGSLLFNKLTWYHIASAFKYFSKYRGKQPPAHA